MSLEGGREGRGGEGRGRGGKGRGGEGRGREGRRGEVWGVPLVILVIFVF